MAAWLTLSIDGESRRVPLRAGLNRIAGATPDVAVEVDGELHLWDDPPKVVHVRGPELASGSGAAGQGELGLENGTRFTWSGIEFTYGCDPPVLEEVPMAEAEPEAVLTGAELAAWRRVQAGLLVELGVADRAGVKRWQDAVKESRFDPDACSREILEDSRFDRSDVRFPDRCGALLRDFLMTPLMTGSRGAGRRARGAAKNGVAFLIAQLVAILVYSLLVAVVLVLARAKWDVSFDGWIDRLLSLGG